MPRDADKISFTAHYTGHVWQRNGLAPKRWATWQGRGLFAALQPLMAVTAKAGGMTLEPMLMARHAAIDHLLDTAIADGTVAQVLEIAAGRSARGLRYVRRFADRGLVYIEADLAPMAAAKARLLDAEGTDAARHRAVAIDAFADAGPESLAAVWRDHLDPATPTAVITEGLINYFDTESVMALWTRIAAALRPAGGVYLSDIHLGLDGHPAAALSRAFRRLLGVATRGKTHFHFGTRDRAVAAMREAGFDGGQVLAPNDLDGSLGLRPSPALDLVRVLQATSTPP